MTEKKKIIILDDEVPLARALELKLTKEGFDARTMPNGKTAIEMMEKEKFDLMILDLVMPHMDGFQILETMKTKNIKLPVIVLSNLSQEEDRKKVLALGATDFFIKSNTPIAEIVERVKNIV